MSNFTKKFGRKYNNGKLTYSRALMKILFIDFRLPYILKDANYPSGGYAVEVNNWLTGLANIGCECGVLVWKGAKSFVNRQLPYELIDTYPMDKGIKFLKYAYLYMPSLMQATKAYKPDLIIQGIPDVQTGMMAFIARRLNIPFCFRVANDIDADERYKNEIPLYAQYSYRYGLRNSAAILSQNQYQYDQLKKRYPDIPNHIIPNPFIPINSDIKQRNRSERGYVAWLAIFRPQKNLPLLLNIALSLPDINFQVAGMVPQHVHPDTQEALDGLKKLNNVHFPGYVKQKEVAEFLSKAVMLLNTSHFEGFSNTFLEAFASGTPLVCSSRVDPGGIIENNHLGFTCTEEVQLKNMISKLYSLDDHEYEEMSERCRKYVFENHNPKEVAKKLLRSISDVVN